MSRDFKSSRKDGQRLGMDRLRCLRLDDPVAETATRTLIRQKQTNRSGSNNQHIGVGSSMQHKRPPLCKHRFRLSVGSGGTGLNDGAQLVWIDDVVRRENAHTIRIDAE